MADMALSKPLNGTIEIAGPERKPFNEFIARFLTATKDPRKVISDPHALYFGTELEELSLVPGDKPRIGAKNFEDWFSTAAQQRH